MRAYSHLVAPMLYYPYTDEVKRKNFAKKPKAEKVIVIQTTVTIKHTLTVKYSGATLC